MVDEAKKTTAVAKRAVQMGQRGFSMDLDGAIRFAQGLIQGGMVPKGITQPGAVVGLIEAGKELGLAPMYALANLTFTNGRLGIMGDAAKALIRRSGTLKPGTDFSEVYDGEENTPNWRCTVTAWRAGQPAAVSRSFSLADGIRAKLIRIQDGKVQGRKGENWIDYSPWSTYTGRMLMYRGLGFLCRDYFSDVLGGAVLQEELRDYPAEPRSEVPPAEPDPLLAEAPHAEPESDVIDAEVFEPVAPVEEAPIPAPEPQQVKLSEPPAEEAATIKAVEKLEGKIVGAETLAQIKKAWKDAAELVAKLSSAEQARLTKLYNQNLLGFDAK